MKVFCSSPSDPRAAQHTLKPTVISLLILPLLAVASISVAWSQPVDCGSLADSGERLKCKHQRLMLQQERLVGNMRNNYGNDIDAKILDRMEREHLRAKRKGERMDAKAFKRMAKKHSLVCETKEWIDPNYPTTGDEDGVCEGNELCEEVIGDQIGDDIQPCTSKGKHKEVCVEVCTDGSASSNRMMTREEALAGTEDETDPELMAELEQSFDDMEAQLDDLNVLLEDNAANFAFVMENLHAAGAASNVCKYSADWQSVVIPILSFTTFANSIARGIADVAERFCDQTAFGANTAAICAVIEGVASLANVANTAFEGVVAGLQANLQDDTGYCLEDLSEGLNDVTATVVDPNGTLPLMDADVQEIHAHTATPGGTLALVNSDVREIHHSTVDPNGDLAVIKSSTLEGTGNSVLMVDALEDHDAALTVHNTALTTHDTALTAHNTETQASMTALAAAMANLRAEQGLAFNLDIEEALAKPDTCNPSLWLPASLGGKMEVVRNHIADLVQRAITSGDPSANTSGAANHLAAADALIGSGSFRKACHKLTRSLQALR